MPLCLGARRGRLVPNISQVAKHAGVSTATVSRVVSGSNGRVSQLTRDRVLRAVERLGYAPNSAAKNLRTQRSGKILVTVPDISNPFFSLILQGIEDAALKAGYAVLIGDTQHEPTREERYAQMLHRKEADGLIFLGHRLPDEAANLVRAAASHRAPVINGCEFSPRLGVPSVHIDNGKAAQAAMDHLYSLGHRHVGVITGPLVSPLSRDRLRGVMAAARKANARKELAIAHGDFSISSGTTAAVNLLAGKQRPTAIFCFNDEMAMGVITTARQRGLHVPEDLSVVGFDDIRFARYFDPPLTTVTQPMREIGEGCVRLLLDVLSGSSRTPASVTLPTQLTIRSTTAAPPNGHAAAGRT
jgi:LacI family transcriptional regulator, repressor for deo operon, udp, cdd, tsx, nupC, and nupG